MECKQLNSIYLFYLIGSCLLSFFVGLISVVAVKVIRVHKQDDMYIKKNNRNNGVENSIFRFKD